MRHHVDFCVWKNRPLLLAKGVYSCEANPRCVYQQIVTIDQDTGAPSGFSRTSLDYNTLPKLLYVLEHKTQYVLIHAPYARIVGIWTIKCWFWMRFSESHRNLLILQIRQIRRDVPLQIHFGRRSVDIVLITWKGSQVSTQPNRE